MLSEPILVTSAAIAGLVGGLPGLSVRQCPPPPLSGASRPPRRRDRAGATLPCSGRCTKGSLGGWMCVGQWLCVDGLSGYGFCCVLMSCRAHFIINIITCITCCLLIYHIRSIGSWVNGVSIFGASDGQSYNNKDVWHNSAVAFEYYDLDQCNGHAANGEYHHHHMPVCIQERLQDDGSKGHSPIYGWLKDGYPMHGPYQAANTLASSCWKTRDYAATSATGCSDGTRSCQLVDPYDYTQGTITVYTI